MYWLRCIGILSFLCFWSWIEASAAAKRVGIFLGSFDPPHLGHAAIVRNSLASGVVDQVLVIPQDLTIHKPFRSRTESRLEMLRILFPGDTRVIIPELSWGFPLTLASIRKIQVQEDVEFYLLAGDDILRSSIHRFLARRVLPIQGWVWFPRKAVEMPENKIDGLPVWIVERTAAEKAISSRRLRERIRAHEPAESLSSLLGPSLAGFVTGPQSPYPRPKDTLERLRLCRGGLASLLKRIQESRRR